MAEEMRAAESGKREDEEFCEFICVEKVGAFA